MFIPKRWLVPGALSLVLFAAILATFLAGPMRTDGVDDASAVGIAARGPATAADYTDESFCTPGVVQAGLSAQEEADIIAYLNAVEANRIRIDDYATNSGIIADSQFNDGGFGDIGMQWREVNNSAPITNIHISGTGNTTTVIVGDDNIVTVFPDESAEEPAPLDLTAAPPAPETPPATVPDPPVTTPVEATPVTVEVAPAT